MTCIPFKIGDSYGILTMIDTEVQCPYCECINDAGMWLEKSKTGLGRMKCKSCKRYMGIAQGIDSKLHVWDLKTTKPGTGH